MTWTAVHPGGGNDLITRVPAGLIVRGDEVCVGDLAAAIRCRIDRAIPRIATLCHPRWERFHSYEE